MRIVLALATALTGSVFGVAGLAAPAHAEACQPPHVSGFTFTGLQANGIPCHEAQNFAVHTTRTGRGPDGWSCSQRISGRHVSTSCHATNGSGHSYHFGYHVH
jgi:hypothetical protein